MRYTQVTMQMDGEITDRQRRTDAEIQRQEALRRVTLGLRLMLEEHIPAAFQGVARFRVALDDKLPFEVDWQQADQVSGIATFFMADKPRLTCLLFSGYDPRHDAFAVKATDVLVAGWCENMQRPPGAGIRGVRDRPLLVCVPWPPSMEGMEKKRMTIYSVCLALAFFERAGAASPAGATRN
jgi:hypothetical protein